MAKKYLDSDGLLYFWQKIKNLFAVKADAIKNITRSGTTFTATRADGTTFTFTQQDNTVAKTTTTPKANGTAAVGSETKYAAGDHVHPLQTMVSGNAGSATKLANARTIDGVSFNGEAAIIHYGTSSTVAATAAKVVACTGFTLVTGAWIAVKFTVTNTAAVANLKLNVNSTGEKSIKYRGGNLPAVGTLAANRTYLFVYDGTNYELIGDLDTAEVNQNAFSNVKVGSTTIAADSKTDTLELAAGSNVTLTPDATNDKVTIAAKDTTYSEATTSSSGLMTWLGPTADGSYLASVEVNGGIVNLDEYSLSASNIPNLPASKITSGTLGTDRIPSLAISKITNLQTTLDGKIATSAKGAANGVCPLNASSKIDATYLPSYVDDVIEAYPRSGQTALSSTWLATESASGTVITPEAGKIYVLMADSGDYAANTQFRWGGSAYVKLADGGVSSITNAEIDTICV